MDNFISWLFIKVKGKFKAITLLFKHLAIGFKQISAYKFFLNLVSNENKLKH